jgi:hypothetical protein
MTLFFVREKTGDAPASGRSSSAESLLLAAIDSFLAQPVSSSP